LPKIQKNRKLCQEKEEKTTFFLKNIFYFSLRTELQGNKQLILLL